MWQNELRRATHPPASALKMQDGLGSMERQLSDALRIFKGTLKAFQCFSMLFIIFHLEFHLEFHLYFIFVSSSFPFIAFLHVLRRVLSWWPSTGCGWSARPAAKWRAASPRGPCPSPFGSPRATRRCPAATSSPWPLAAKLSFRSFDLSMRI